VKKIHWIIGGILGVWLGPWILLWLVFTADDIVRELSLWRYQPTSLADAVAYKHATPEIVARFIDQGADVNQHVPANFDGQLIPLVADASSRGNVEVTRLLLHRGARRTTPTCGVGPGTATRRWPACSLKKAPAWAASRTTRRVSGPS
jgi:hypothetical protein